MRISAFASTLALTTLLSVGPLWAVKPSAATIETLPVGNGASILINIEEGDEVADYHVTLPDGTLAKLRTLKLTKGELNERSPLTEPLTIAPRKVPAPVFFRNLTRSKLRVTLQQPKAPASAEAKVKATYCTPTCKLDPADYTALCKADGDSLTRCTPDPTALAICGTEECNAIRKACDGPGCTVDLYKALEACACSVTRVLAPSTFPVDGVQAARYMDAPEGQYVLQSTSTVSDPKLAELARSIGRTKINFTKVASAKLGDYPTALFDAALFSRKDGLTNEGGDVYRFLIEQDPAAPVHGAVLKQDASKKDPPPSDYVQGLTPRVITVAANPTLTADHPGEPMRVVVVPLDDTGVTNWRYLNPRNPACINCSPDGTALPATELPAGVLFRNRTQDRTFLISVTLPASTATNAIEDAFKCAAGQPCKITRSVAPQNTVLFDATILALFKNSLIKFDVSLYGETITLGNAAAYLSLNNPFDENTKLIERASSTNFKTKLSLSGRVDPQLRAIPTVAEVTALVPTTTPAPEPAVIEGILKNALCSDPKTIKEYVPDNEPSICAEHPYVDGNTQAYRGSGSINLTANLSDRADGSVTLSFREGNYGADIDKTAVSEYNVTIYGINGLSLKFGKADFLIPSNGIAIAESGEGFLYSFRNFGLGHVVRRESDAGIPLQTNQDKKDWFFQARSLPIAQGLREEIAAKDMANANPERTKQPVNFMQRMATIFRSADLFVVRGEDRKANSTYTTAGGEIFFAQPARPAEQTDKGTELHNIFNGSFAYYQSRRHLDEIAPPATPPATPPTTCVENTTPTPSPLCDGRGNVWLLTVNWVPSMVIAGGTNVATTPHTVSFAIGEGTGNKLGTKRDEGYIGDPATFTPDRLFLKTFIGKMNSKNIPYEPVGLSNKRYMALTYTNSETSLFDFVASALGVTADVNSRSTIVSLREYKLRYPENGARGAARELNVTFNIEVPKGVTFTFDANYLEPGEAFKDRITERAWSFGANVTLSL